MAGLRYPITPGLCAALAMTTAPAAHADNERLNDGVIANVYTIQQQAGRTGDVKINRELHR